MRLATIGFLILGLPLRLTLLAMTLLLYWAYLKVILFLCSIGLFSERTRDGLAQIVVRPGAYFLLFNSSVFGGITRHHVTEEQAHDIVSRHCDKMLEPGEESSEEERQLMKRNQSKPPFIVVSNHVSVLDPAVCMHEFGEMSFIAKEGIAQAPIISILAKQLKCLFVGRKTKGSVIPQMLQRIKSYYEDPEERNRLLIFPEATTTNGSHVIRFHDGAFIPGAPVQPFALAYPWNNFNPAWCTSGQSELLYIFHLFTQFWQEIEVVHFPPYYPSRAERANPSLFAENMRKLIVHGSNLHLKRNQMQLSNERFDRVKKKAE